MPFRIQRPPRGLNNILSIFGGQTPVELEDRIRGTVELLQLYGLNQEQVVGNNNAALAENVDMATGANQANAWVVLYDASVTVIKTATMTALRCTLWVRIGGTVTQEYALASGELGPFGANETGAATLAWNAPYPRLLPPTSLIGCRIQILGTDATANTILGAHIGVLG